MIKPEDCETLQQASDLVDHSNLYSKMLLSAAMLLLPSACATASELPAPTDVPPGPAGVTDDLGPELPLAAIRSPGGPEISMISDMALPQETLVICGDGLENARLKIWSGNGLVEVQPLRAANDRMQAVVPESCAVSTMLVWPVSDGRAGEPIRVNGATAWWVWPARTPARSINQTVRICGKNLTIGDRQPRVYLRGKSGDQRLPVVKSNPFHVEARLPDMLEEGVYQLWCHNGTGGKYGWSEQLAIDVVAMPSDEGLPEFDVRDFGAVPNDREDDYPAIAAAMAAAKEAGGGIVRFSTGTFRLSRPVEVGGEGDSGIHLMGAGMGNHRWRNDAAPNDHHVIHEVSGDATILRPIPGEPYPQELITITRRYSSIRDLSLLNHADEEKQRCLSVRGHDVLVERVRGIVTDERPLFAGFDVLPEELSIDEFKRRLQDGAVLRIDAPGKANIVIRDCEFHHPGAGIDTPPIRDDIRHASGICRPGTDYIRIANCIFRGYFDGRLEPVDPTRRLQAFRGWHNVAWNNTNSRNVIVEKCDVAGADKQRFKVVTRMLNHGNSSIGELYLAENVGHDLAPTSMSPGYHENKGEQILFHLWYPQGGLFDVASADHHSVTIDPTDPRYMPAEGRHPGVTFNGTAFSTIQEDIDVNPTHWIVFVCAGRGVGQYREVRSCQRTDGSVVLQLDRPWRIMPDKSSRCMLNAAYRRIIIWKNFIDGGPSVDRRIKSHGVLFWANAFENIVAENTLRNMTGGVLFNTFFRCPTGWNLTRGNRMEHIHGNGGDTVFPGRAAFYVDHVRVGEPVAQDRVWYGVGNIARNNDCRDGDVAAFLHRPDYARIDPRNPDLPEATRELLLMPRGDNTVVGYGYPHTPEGGLMMGVMENNRFSDVQTGFVVSSPINWLLLRNNKLRVASPDAPSIIDESRGEDESAIELMLIDK